jgi:rare lipoprotein A
VVQVRNLRNNRTVLVEITDRGPFVKGRIIDLSEAAAKRLGMIGPGTTPVEIRLVRRVR